MKGRDRFLAEMLENILLPYETSDIYEEEIYGEFENRFEKEYFQQFLRLAGPDALVLDLACGDGRHTLRLSANIGHVVALDLSDNSLKMAKKKCSGGENIVFVKASMFDMPFANDTFDGVWFSQAFEYIPPDKRTKFLTCLNRILKPGGLLYLSVETWMLPSLGASLKMLWGDFRLFCYWRFIKGKPLLWGEYLYYLSSKATQTRYSGWHYHAHTDKRTLRKLLNACGFTISKMCLYDGYVYVSCHKATG